MSNTSITVIYNGMSLTVLYQRNKYMFNFIDIYIFIPMGGFVGMGPCALLCQGPIMLLRRPC